MHQTKYHENITIRFSIDVPACSWAVEMLEWDSFSDPISFEELAKQNRPPPTLVTFTWN